MFRRSGIVLVTTLLFVSLIVMFSVLVAQQGKQSMENGVGLSDAEQAYLAALSGVDFAKSNLFYNKAWGRSGSLGYNLADPVNSNVRFDFGGDWVKGYLGYRSQSSYDSMFSISFSKSGSAPSDHQICRYPSCNNLDSESPVAATGSNRYHRDVPASSFYIVSKGTSGKAVKYVEAVFMSAGPSALSGGTTIGGNVTVEGIASLDDLESRFQYSEANPLLKVLRSDKKGKTVVTSAGSLTAFNKNGGSTSVDVKSNVIGGSLGNRSKLLNVAREGNSTRNLSISSSKLRLGGTEYDPSDEKTGIDGLSFTQESRMDTSDLETMQTYSSAVAGISAQNKLSGGTYVYVKDCTTGKNSGDGKKSEWRYIPSSYNGTYEQRAKNVITALKSNSNVAYAPKDNKSINFGGPSGRSRTVTVSGNLELSGDTNFMVVNKVNGTSNQTSSGDGGQPGFGEAGQEEFGCDYQISSETVDFSILSRKTPGDSSDSDPAILSPNGRIVVDGEVTGSGKIFANGEVAFNSGSSLETKAQSGVAVWASGDISIKPAENVSVETLSATVDVSNNANGDQTALATAVKNELQKQGKDNVSLNEVLNDTANDQNDTVSQKENQPPAAGDVRNIAISKSGDSSYKLTYDNIAVTFKDSRYYGFSVSSNGTEEQAGPGPFDMDSFYVLDDSDPTYNYMILVSRDMQHYYSNGAPNLDDFKVKILKNKKGESEVTELGGMRIDLTSGLNAEDVSWNGNTETSSSELFSLTYNNKIINFATDAQVGDVTDTSSGSSGNSTLTTNTAVITQDDSVKIVRKAIKSSPTELKGTVYSASGNINIDGGGSRFDLRGAFITLSGNLIFKDILTATLLYDPDYVPFFNDKGIITSSVFIRTF